MHVSFMRVNKVEAMYGTRSRINIKVEPCSKFYVYAQHYKKRKNDRKKERKKEREKKHQYIYAGARRYSYLLIKAFFINALD